MTTEEAQGGWFKSSLSDTGGGCVEVRFVDGGVEVRHSKNPGGAVLKYTDEEWDAFNAGAARGEFKRPLQ